VRYTEIGTIEDKDGNEAPVRWDSETGVVQVRVYRFPSDKLPYWDWVTVGIARAKGTAVMTAMNWVKGVEEL
jgi:hypothetical protein